MAQYDGSIRINTNINTKEASAQLMNLEKRIIKTADNISSLRLKMDTLKNAVVPTKEFENLQKELSTAGKEMEELAAQKSKLADVDAKIKELSKSSAEYASKMQEIAEQKIPTQEYDFATKEVERLEKALEGAFERKEKFLKTGGNESSRAFKGIEYDIEKLEEKLSQAQQEVKKLTESGKSFTFGTGTEQYKNISEKYEVVNQQLEKQKLLHDEIINKQANVSDKIDDIKAKMQELVQEGKAFRLGKETEEYSELEQQLKNAKKEMFSLKREHNSLLVKQEQVSSGYKEIGNSGKQAFRNIEKVAKSSMDRLLGSVKKLGTIMAAAFITGKIAELGKETISAASDLATMESQFSQVFGEMEQIASKSLSKIAAQAGSTEERMKASYTQIAAFAKTTGMNISDALEIANRAMVAISDSAAFYDRTLEETTESLQSFLKGNYENDAALGLSATETTRNAAANKLYGKSFVELSEAQKQLTLLTMVEDANKLSGALGQAARESDTWTNQIGNLNQSIINLKASIGKFFLPLAVQAVKIIVNIINAITAMISRLYTAASAIRSFSELLTGKESKNGAPIDDSNQKIITGIGDSYNNAAEGAENLADENNDIAKSAKKANKALNNQLSSYDKINSLSKKSNEISDNKGEIGAGLGFAGAEAIDDIDFGKVAEGENQFEKLAKIFDAVIAKAKELGDLFKQGFFDGLGDWEYRWQIIKDSIASIKESLKNIFTDPSVLAAADGWAKSFAYLLGSIVGSTASIGLTIAANLLGGISKYLEQNKDRIKEYLISMFNIWEEVNYMFSDFFQSIAYVFESFASEQGQQLTANIIGIFTNAFMGITELASKIFRDISQIIIKPFTDNKEKFRAALEGFLGVLSQVTGTIKDSIDATFDKINQVYDEHLKPFFDSVAQGLSDLVGKFIDFWNGNVQPMLEQMAKDFDKLWKTHIQPLLNNIADFLGKVSDLLKALWENILKPLIAWVIENIFPKLIPVIESIWTAIKDFVAHVADAINGFVEIISGIVDVLTGIFTGDLDLVFQGALGIIKGFIDQFKNIIQWGIDLVVNFIVTQLNSILVFFPEFGQDIIQGLIDGLISFKDKVIETITDIADSIIEWFKDLFGIHSPSTVMSEIGTYIMQGLIEGLKALVEKVVQFFTDLKEKVVTKLTELKENAVNKANEIKQNVINAFNNLKQNAINVFNNLKSTVSNIWNGIVGTVQSAVSKIKNAVKSALEAITSVKETEVSYSGTRASSYANASTSRPNFRSAPIPHLATGAVIPPNKEFLAVLGDQKKGTNIETPLDTMIDAFKQALKEMNNGGGVDKVEVTTMIDFDIVAKKLVKLNEQHKKKTGKPLLT